MTRMQVETVLMCKCMHWCPILLLKGHLHAEFNCNLLQHLPEFNPEDLD